MRNRIVTIILAVALACALLPTAALADTATPSGQHYADVPADAWYAEAVNAMTEGGLLTGYTDGLFHPDDPITYAQFSMVLARVLGLETSNPADVAEGTHWAQTAYNGLGYEQPSLNKPYHFLEWMLKTDYDIKTGPVMFTYPDGTLFKTVKNPDGTFRDDPDDIAGEFVGGQWVVDSTPFSLDDNIFRAEVLETLVKLASEMTVYKANRHNEDLVPEMNFDGPYYTGLQRDRQVTKFEQISPKIWVKEDIPDWEDRWDEVNEYWAESRNDPNGILILLAYNIGITKGIDANGTCNAYGNVTRAQLCQFLWNMGITTKNSVKQVLPVPKAAYHLLRASMPDGCRLPHKVTGQTVDGLVQTGGSSGPTETQNVGCCTTLQFYETYPTYKVYHTTDFMCRQYKPDYNGKCTCSFCLSGRTEPNNEQNQQWEDQKQAAYDEHNQWLKEFEGTRQWEIATGKA